MSEIRGRLTALLEEMQKSQFRNDQIARDNSRPEHVQEGALNRYEITGVWIDRIEHILKECQNA